MEWCHWVCKLADAVLSRPPNEPPSPQESTTETTNEQEQTSDTEATPAAPAAEGQAEQDAATDVVKEEYADEPTQAPTQAEEAEVESSSSNSALPRLDGLFVKSAFQTLKTTDEDIQAGIDESVARQLEPEGLAAEEGDAPVQYHSVDSWVDAQVTPQSDVQAQEVAQAEANKVVTPEPVEAEIPASPQAAAPQSPTPQAAAGLAGMFGNASPEEIAALMAYLQQLQAQKTGGSEGAAAPQAAAPKAAPQESSQVQPATPKPSMPESHSAQAVASMTEPIEPSGQEPEIQQHAGDTSPGPAIPEPVYSESNIPEPPKSDSQLGYETMLDAVAPVVEASSDARTGREDARAPSLEDFDEESAASDPVAQSTDDIYDLDSISREQREGKTHDLESVVEEELSDKASEALAKQSTSAPSDMKEMEGYASRLPRNVQTFYLQPLRRAAQYGVPACDLQLRSYSVRPLESFCDFALRAAYYLGLPAYGPTPLPKIIQRWTVPKSTFIHKKSQENFERITRRRLIQIKDGHPETVQIWLAFLQKHQQAAVGMKANMWEFSGLSKLLCDCLCATTSQARYILILRTRRCQGDERHSRVFRTDHQRQAPSPVTEEGVRDGGEGGRVSPEREISGGWGSVHWWNVEYYYYYLL